MTANTKLASIGRFMSLVLRHQPDPNEVWLVEAVPAMFIEVVP